MGNGKNWRLPYIGDFFIDLARQLFGGEKVSYNAADEGDIINYDLDARFEVKGSGNRDTPVIKCQQFEGYLNLPAFPVKYCWYVIFWYRNDWWGSNRSISKETPTKESIPKFLASNTMIVFILDSQVISAIRNKRGDKIRKIHGEDTEVINFGRTYLREFEKYPEMSVYQLGLDGFEVAQEKIEMKFHGNPMGFKLVMVLPSNVIPKVLKIVRSKITDQA